MRQKLRADLGAVRQTELLDRLARKYGKYALVVGVAKRAHDLKERIRSPLERSGGGIVNRAIDEIAEGRVKIRGGEPEQESD
jgi:DNA-directed RNA polymerase subunit K/omega